MSNNGRIPFLDLIKAHAELDSELVSVFQKVLKTASFVGGPMVEEFEREFAQFCGAAHCVGVASGTDAVRFALMAAGIGPGEIALTVPNTFIATGEGISQSGAEPRFVDVDERTYNMDPTKVSQYFESCCTVNERLGVAIDNKTGKPVTALVPVHLYGQMADMDSLLEIAGKYRLTLIEDACQAHGAEYFSKREGRWKKAGSMGRAAAFSFYPGKNLGACGEAGAVTTNDAEVAKQVRMLRDHGQIKKYHHDIQGYNGRLDSVQAGILSVKLKHLLRWNQSRREHARIYNELFRAATNIITPYEPSWSRTVYHLYVVQVEHREAIQSNLADQSIGTGIHYPIPLHLQKAYASLGYGAGDFPVSEKAAHRILSLPMFPGISTEDQSKVAQAVVQSVQRSIPQRTAAASV
jgi:dTDP-4-amino-4,6-dideoxygalactose transaminase